MAPRPRVTRPRCDRVSLGRRGRVVYWGYWTCRVGGTSPRCCVGVYSSGSLRRYSAARGPRTDTSRSGPEEDAGARLLYRRHRYFALAYRRVPLLGTLIRYSEAGSSRPHAGPLFRSWALSSAREPAISYEGGLAHAPISRFELLNTRRCRVASLDVSPARGLVLHSLFALWPRGISFGSGHRWALELHSHAL